MSTENTRTVIVQAADRLFYEHGFENTSFAAIAEAVGISRGNFYHHFKSKDEILAAVIALRAQKTQTLLDTWERDSTTPKERIGCFINILIMNRTKILKFGCPVGTLCSELAKLEHDLQNNATELFSMFRGWLKRQFTQWGFKEEADALALHVLSFSQGVATLANAFKDERFVQREVRQMHLWLDALS